MNILRLIISISLWVIMVSYNSSAQENENYHLEELVNSTNKTEVMRAVLQTFNDFGYYIASIDEKQGIIKGGQIDNNRIPPLRDRDLYEMDKIQQTIFIKVSSESAENSKISMRIIYRRKLVEDMNLYQEFINRLNHNISM